jgi:uncharacterized protein (DUF58 family)
MPVWDESLVAATAVRLRLGVDARRRSGLGARLGRGTGAALEFHEHRAYAPGDDLRHLDWGVYARTDQLVLRRHRQEVSPRVEVFLDLSASMAATPAKLALATALTALLATLAEADGVRPRLWLCAGEVRRADAQWRAALRAAVVGGAAGLAGASGELLPGAQRILVSDGLCAEGGASIVRRLGAGAGQLCLVQVLTADEVAPPVVGACRLEDREGGALDLVLDAAAVAAYGARLQRHHGEWQAALVGRGAGLIGLRSEESLAEAVRRLLAAGVVETRAGR